MRLLCTIVIALLALLAFQPLLAQETVTLDVWDFGGVEFEYLDSILIPAFEARYPNIKIQHLGIPESDYNLKMETAIASSQVPDVALQSYSYRLWRAGHVRPLDDLMERDGFSINDFYPIFQSWNTLEGSVYAFPVTMHLWGMIVNVDMFEEAGLTVPSVDESITFAQWLDYARALNKPSDDFNTRVWGSVNFTPNWNSMNNYMSDPYVLGPDGRDCLQSSQTPDWIDAWTMLLTAYQEQLVPDSNPALVGDFAGDLFQAGKVAMSYGTESGVIAARNAGLNVAFVGQPVVTPGWKGNVGAWDVAYGIMKASQHHEEAWTFLKWLTTEGALLISERGAEITNVEISGSPPTYRPLAAEWAGSDPFRQEVLALQERVVPPPFSPDIWASVDPFYVAWQRMTEEGMSVEAAVAAAAEECQYITDDLWDTWDFLGS
jgi:multiple sugar transport system substrate-binding protein